MADNVQPQLEDVFELAERNAHVGINVCVLGEVARYHAGKAGVEPSVDVQILARPLLRDGTRFDYPIITRVPIAQWSFGPIVIRAVPEKGDGLMCHVFDREIITWLKRAPTGPQTYDPVSRRTHSASDIVAVPSMRQNLRTPKGTDAARQVYIGSDTGKGTFLKINVQTGAIELEASATVDTKAGVSTTIDAALVKLGGSLAVLGNARLTDTTTGSAALVAYLTLVNTVLLKIPVPPTTAEKTALGTLLTALLLPNQLGAITKASTKVLSE